jgi:hypothetical protein
MGIFEGVDGAFVTVAEAFGPGCPFVRGPTSDDCHVVARLVRQGVMACEPRAYAARTCVVGRRRESKIAKPVSQFAQVTRRMAQRLDTAEAARDTIAPSAWPFPRRSFAQSGGADGAGGPADRPPSDLSFHFVLLWRVLLFRRTIFAEQVIHHKNLRKTS